MNYAEELRKVVQNSVAKMVRQDKLEPEEYQRLIRIYPKFTEDLDIGEGKIVQYNGEIYEVILAHITQSDWTPPNTPALFRKVVPENVIPVWTQPTGAHDAYDKGDKVVFNGEVWESTVDANVWSPDEFGWVLV
jgi:hypothetical protein